MADIEKSFEPIDELPPLEQPRGTDLQVFGPGIEEAAASADQAKEIFGTNSTEYGTALLRLGDAYVIEGADGLADALSAYETALLVFTRQDSETAERADAHHRIAAVHQRRGDHEDAADHLQAAIELWEHLELDAASVEMQRADLAELRRLADYRKRNQRTPSLPDLPDDND